jgi:outer membrane protein assembly factor BamB
LDKWPDDGPQTLWKTEVGGGHASPVVSQGRVFVAEQRENQSWVTCLDAKSGERLWSVPFAAEGKGPHFNTTPPYATPTVDGQVQVIFHARGGIVSVDPRTGKEHWFFKGSDAEPDWNVIMTPLWAGD